MFLWRQTTVEDLAAGRASWWQGAVWLGSAPPRVVLCPMPVNWLVYAALRFWRGLRWPRAGKWDRIRDAAYSDGYRAGYAAGYRFSGALAAPAIPAIMPLARPKPFMSGPLNTLYDPMLNFPQQKRKRRKRR